MEPGIAICLVVFCLIVSVFAVVYFGLWAGANMDLSDQRATNDDLIKACKRLVLNAVRKNTITDDWECRLCGDLPNRDDGHHLECPVWLAKVAIAKAEEPTNG